MSLLDLGGDPKRAVRLLGFCALCLAGIGFIRGTDQAEQAEVPNRGEVTTTRPADDAPFAVRYDQIGSAGILANAGWSSHLSSAQGVVASLLPQPTPSLEDKRAALADRAERRAYFGAPPVVPHRVTDRGAESCLICHERGLQLGRAQRAPAMPHETYVNCLQCHAPPAESWFDASRPANSFQGAPEVEAGQRAWAGAPPVIPHGTSLRQRCVACHGTESAYPALRTTHPERANCRQCHAASAGYAR